MPRLRHPHRLQFVDRTMTKNASHERVPADKVLKTIWGTLKNVTGRRGEIAEQFRGVATHFARVNFDPDFALKGESIKAEHHMIFDSRRFGITGIYRPNERGRELMIVFEELQT